MITVVARIPEDNGKTIYFSNTLSLQVGPSTCDRCDDDKTPATMLVKGEENSYGWEPLFICQACHDQIDSQIDDYYKAADVEDKAPKPGHVFMVNECTNHDGHGDWCRFFTSFREASGFYRKIGDLAARWSGLYPDKGVREVTVEKQAEIQARIKCQDDWELEQLLEDDDYDNERYEEEEPKGDWVIVELEDGSEDWVWQAK